MMYVKIVVMKTIEEHLGEEWFYLLSEEIRKPYFANLLTFVSKEYNNTAVFPQKDDVFKAFKLVQPSEVKVVIIGQDPYHTPGVAHGLAFSTKEDKTPPSLHNIFKEIETDVYDGLVIDFNNDLTRWANQGVFLLNTALTVRKGEPLSHSNIGWETLTNNVIRLLTKNYKDIVFLLWGSNAHKKEYFIDEFNRHHILKAAHPSPFSAYRGFFGCKHFTKTNEILELLGKPKIVW